MSATTTPYEQSFESAGVRASLLEYLHACPICDGTELSHYCRVPSLFAEGEYIRYERCARCDTVLRNPRLPTAARHAKYEDKVLPEAAKQLEPLNQLHYAYMTRLMNRLMPPGVGRRLLDFGCGSGGFMLEARKAGFEVSGLELNRDLAAFVEKTYDMPVHQGLVSDEDFTQERFDVIISSQVFEHLVDPRGTLRQLLVNLKSPGLFLVEVPNLRHIRERLSRGAVMDDSHLFYFSSKSLPRLLEAEGLEIVKVQEGLRPYRVFNGKLKGLPDGVHEIGQKVLTLCQVRTGLSVLARRA